MDEYEGYLRLLAAVPVSALTLLFLGAKAGAVDREGVLSDLPESLLSPPFIFPAPSANSTIAMIARIQARVRWGITVFSAAVMTLAVVALYCWAVWRLPIWPDISLPSAGSGYQAIGALLLIALKLFGLYIALAISAIPFFGLGALVVWVLAPAIYCYLAFGSMLHVGFFLHWVMTGDYFGEMLSPSGVSLALALTALNLLLSDLGDVAVFLADLAISSSEAV